MHTPRYKDTIYESIVVNDDNEQKHDRMNHNILGFYDVICGRHKAAFDNIGNRRFRVLVALAHEKYSNASTRAHKSIVIKDIVDSVHNGGGRFLQRLGCNWVELDDKQTHDKVGHALRDMAVASKSKTSNRKSRNSSMDFSDQSNTSISESRVSLASVSNQQPTRIEECRSEVNGYVVSFPNDVQAEKTVSLDFSVRSIDFDFDANDTSLEPIAWPTTSMQSHRRSDPLDEYVITRVFTSDETMAQSAIYSL